MNNINPMAPHTHNLLTPLQQEFLLVFAQIPDQGQFYLTDGTALAEFYLGHRLSYDLDFFTGVEGLVQPVSFQIEKRVEQLGLGIKVVRRFATYVEFSISSKDETIKVELALDSPFRFESPIPCAPGIQVNNYIDLSVDKLLAYYGRAEPRDAIDLFFILKTETPEVLFDKAMQKDTGFDAYWFATALNRCLDFPDEPERWPVTLLVDWDPKEIKSLFQAWSNLLMEGIY